MGAAVIRSNVDNENTSLPQVNFYMTCVRSGVGRMNCKQFVKTIDLELTPSGMIQVRLKNAKLFLERSVLNEF